MNGLTRRRFLLASGAAAVAATAAGVGWKDLADRTRSDPLPVGTGVLVLVTLYGGNDGLNTVVPVADPAYQSARPELAYAQNEVLDLGDGLGLNPGAGRAQAAVGRRHAGDRPRRRLPEARPQPLPLDGHLADRLAGPPRPAPAGSAAGWTRTAATPRLRVSLEPVLPPLLAGATHRGRRVAAPRARAARPARSRRPSRGSGSRSRASRRCRRARPARSPTCSGARSTASGGDADEDVDGKATTGAGGQGALARPSSTSSRAASRRASRPGSTRCSLGGFDTHADERGTQQRLLTAARRGASRVPRPGWRHRPRPRRRADGLLRVRSTGGRQRQRRHRPRHRRSGVRARAPR